jgi:twitching motility protein PilT
VPGIFDLIDMFPGEQGSQVRTLLSASLAAVVWQQLLPRIDKKGLVLACEVMTATPAVRALIRQDRTCEIPSILQSGRKQGMCTMEQTVKDLVENGYIDPQCVDGKEIESHLSNLFGT